MIKADFESSSARRRARLEPETTRVVNRIDAAAVAFSTSGRSSGRLAKSSRARHGRRWPSAPCFEDWSERDEGRCREADLCGIDRKCPPRFRAASALRATMHATDAPSAQPLEPPRRGRAASAHMRCAALRHRRRTVQLLRSNRNGSAGSAAAARAAACEDRHSSIECAEAFRAERRASTRCSSAGLRRRHPSARRAGAPVRLTAANCTVRAVTQCAAPCGRRRPRPRRAGRAAERSGSVACMVARSRSPRESAAGTSGSFPAEDPASTVAHRPSSRLRAVFEAWS